MRSATCLSRSSSGTDVGTDAPIEARTKFETTDDNEDLDIVRELGLVLCCMYLDGGGGTAVIYFATVCIRWQCSLHGFITDEDGSASQQLDVAVRGPLLTITAPNRSAKN